MAGFMADHVCQHLRAGLADATISELEGALALLTKYPNAASLLASPFEHLAAKRISTGTCFQSEGLQQQSGASTWLVHELQVRAVPCSTICRAMDTELHAKQPAHAGMPVSLVQCLQEILVKILWPAAPRPRSSKLYAYLLAPLKRSCESCSIHATSCWQAALLSFRACSLALAACRRRQLLSRGARQLALQ